MKLDSEAQRQMLIHCLMNTHLTGTVEGIMPVITDIVKLTEVIKVAEVVVEPQIEIE